MKATEKIQYGLCIAIACLLLAGWAATLANGLAPGV